MQFRMLFHVPTEDFSSNHALDISYCRSRNCITIIKSQGLGINVDSGPSTFSTFQYLKIRKGSGWDNIKQLS